MTLPVNFGALAAGKQNLSLFDTQFAAVEPLIPTLTAAPIADVPLSSMNQFFTGPQVAQGTVGTFFASGTVTVDDSAAASTFEAKLWDGTTTIGITIVTTRAASSQGSMTLSGIITNPAGNIKISVANSATTTGRIINNSNSLTVLRLA